MRLTAIDIDSQEFNKSLRGYNTEEVDSFLNQVRDDYEALYKENFTLKEKLATYMEKLEHYTQIESTIQSTLLLAQNAAEQAKGNAEKESDLLVKSATDKAEKILEKAQRDASSISNDYDKIKQDFIKFRSKFRNFLQMQMDTFDNLNKDFNIAEFETEEIKSIEAAVVQEQITAEDEELGFTKIVNEQVELKDELKEELKIKTIDENEISVDELGDIKRFFVTDN